MLDDGRFPTAEEDYQIAVTEFRRGNLEHAAHHICHALATDPAKKNWFSLLDEIATQVNHPDEALDPSTRQHYSHLAGRAYILARHGEIQKALDKLSNLSYNPLTKYGVWARDWISQHNGRLDLGSTTALLNEISRKTIGFLHLRVSEVSVFRGWAPWALAIMSRSKDDKDWALALTCASGVLRRAGLVQQAVDAAAMSMNADPTAGACSQHALALRACGRFDEALNAFKIAQDLDPEFDYTAERIRVHFDSGNFQLAWDELSTYIDDDSGIEFLSMSAYLRRKLAINNDTEDADEIFGPSPTTDTFFTMSVPMNRKLQTPRDAGAQFDKDIVAVYSYAHYIESPSCRLARVLNMRTTDISKIPFKFKEVPYPDPRVPRRPVSYAVWKYMEPALIDVHQAVGPPSELVQSYVTEIATSIYFLPRWWNAAKTVGQALGVAEITNLLGAMVHPPTEITGDKHPADWVFSHQCAAALILAHVDTGWAGSKRREVLFSLVDGVVDWTTDAAIIALCEIAIDEPDALVEISERFWCLFKEIPTPGQDWYGETLTDAYNRLPGMPWDRLRSFQQRLEERLEEYSNEEESVDETGDE